MSRPASPSDSASGPNPDRVFELFDHLRGLEKDERSKALREAAGDDPELMREVASLLGHDTSSLRAPLSDEQVGAMRSLIARSTDSANAPALPDVIGDYQIVGLIGEGGMGRVLEARQERPRRRVALKIIRPGYVSTEATRRFAAEIDLLGRLHHPGIAQVFDAGEAELGGIRQPFVAMEFIEGTDLRSWSEGRSLSERVDVLIAIAETVHYAHQRGVIHRDLKPANIIVTSDEQPKILDFGVARAIAPDGDVSPGPAHATMTGQMIGTLDYMSPEQIEGRREDLGFASDVYALGVIGFEILAGSRPHELTGRPLAAFVNEVCRHAAPGLRRRDASLPVPLEQVIGKALAKSIEDRYPTTAALAEDLTRWREHRAVQARPPSSFQNLRLFARRNPALSGAVALLILVLGASAIIGAFLVERASDARDLAEREAETSGRAAYRSALSSAEAALRIHDSAEARRILDATDSRRRDWIWQHLRAKLDQSSSRVTTDPSSFPFPKTPLVFGRSDRVRYIEYAGGIPGEVHVIEVDLKTERVHLRRRVTDIDGYDIQDRSLPVFALVGEDRLAALDRERRLVWTEDAARGGDRRVHSIDEAPVLARGRGLEIREVDGVRIGRDEETGSIFLLHDAGRHFSFTRVSPDRRMVAVAGIGRDRRVIMIHDRDSGERLHELRGHRETPRSLSFSPDSARAAIPITDGTIHVHDLRGQKPLRVLYGHGDRVGEAVFSPDGALLATGSQDTTIRIWNEEREISRDILVGHDAEVFALGFRTPSTLVSLDSQGELRQWDLGRRRDGVLRAHELFVYPLALSPDGRTLASGSWDGHVALWDATSGDLIARHRVYDSGRTYSLVSGLAFTPNGEALAITVGDALYADHELRIVRADTGVLVQNLGKVGALSNLVVTRNPPRLVVTSQEGGHVYDPDGWREAARFAAKRRRLALHPDGRHIVHRMGPDHVIRDLETLEVQTRLRHHSSGLEQTPGEIVGVAFSPDGRRVCLSEKSDVLVFDAGSGELLHRLSGHTGLVYTVVFSPDGRYIVTGSDDRSIRFWDTRDFREIVALRGHGDHVQTLLWSKDGRRLYSASGDYTVRLWDTLTRRERLALSR